MQYPKNSIDRFCLFIWGCMSLVIGCNCPKPMDQAELPQVNSAKMPPNGINNVGNTCYMNASLQVIAACYADNVREGSPLKKLINKINDPSHGVVTKEEVEEFRKSLQGGPAQHFVDSRAQEDAQEFLMRCNEEYKFLADFNSVPQRIIIRGDTYCSKDFPPDDQNMFLVHFPDHNNQPKGDSHNLSTLIDQDQLSFKLEENEWDVNLTEFKELNAQDIKHSAIKDLLQKLNPIQQRNNKNIATNHLHGSYIAKLPAKLCIYMNRSQQDDNNNNIKIEDKILGAKEIELREGASVKENPKVSFKFPFQLCGFILHHGVSLKGGHYTAYVKRNNQWYHADDANVRAIDETEAIKQSEDGYLLFYTKGIK